MVVATVLAGGRAACVTPPHPPVALLAAAVAARLKDEEAYLVRNLPGYVSQQRAFAVGAWHVVIQEFESMSRIPWKEVCKFLAGAFFVSSGVLFYLYVVGVSVPLVGTNFVHTPEISGLRSIANFALFLITFYFGFIRK